MSVLGTVLSKFSQSPLPTEEIDRFIAAINNCVNLGTASVDEAAIQRLTNEKLASLNAGNKTVFVSALKAYLLKVQSGNFLITYGLANLTGDDFTTKISEIMRRKIVPKDFQNWLRTYLSSKVCLPLLSKAVFIGVVSSAIFSLGIFGKNNTGGPSI